MHPHPAPLVIDDPATGRRWTVPVRPVTRLDADVAERWFVNAALPPERFRQVVPAPFLEPDLRHGVAILSLCRIRMRHGAPDWVPLAMGPASDNCALRVGCVDRRDGSPAVWVDRRCTTHPLGRALALLGFPPVETCLRVARSGDDGLELATADGAIACRARPGTAAAPGLFADAAELTAWVTAGVRSYAATRRPDRFLVVDLEKGSPNAFAALPGWQAQLATPWGGFTADGVYRTIDGRYQWRLLGAVDAHGRPEG